MRGIIALSRLLFICILLSKCRMTSEAFFCPGYCGVEENTDWCSILPALAFSLDMFEKTKQSYGVNEVLLASVLGAVVFAVFAAQPLVIVGVTGGFVPILGAVLMMLTCIAQVRLRCLITLFTISCRRVGRPTLLSCVGLGCKKPPLLW